MPLAVTPTLSEDGMDDHSKPPMPESTVSDDHSDRGSNSFTMSEPVEVAMHDRITKRETIEVDELGEDVQGTKESDDENIKSPLLQKRTRRAYGPPIRTAGSGLRERQQAGNEAAVILSPHSESNLVEQKALLKMVKRRGRPPRQATETTQIAEETVPRRRGRPRKDASELVKKEEQKPDISVVIPKRRGRPRKSDKVEQAASAAAELCSSQDFSIDSFTLSAIDKATAKRRRLRIKLGKPFVIEGSRISFEFSDL